MRKSADFICYQTILAVKKGVPPIKARMGKDAKYSGSQEMTVMVG